MWDSWPTVSLHEVTSESEGDKYFIFLNKHDRSDDYLKISLLNGIDAYHVEVTRDDIEDMAKRSRIPLSEFENLAVSALTCENLTEDNFKYNVSRDEQSLHLTWKKVVREEENMNIKLGILRFKIVNGANEVWNTLQQLSKYQSERSRAIQELKQERENLQSVNNHLRDILETKVVSKEELEKELFTKFVLVLNKKKEKCREYKEELSRIKASRKSNAATSEQESDSSEVKLTPPKKSKKDAGLLFDDSSDDSVPVHPQRVVKNKTTKRTVQRQEQTKPKTRNRRNCTTPSTASLTDTQDLMDEL